MTTLGDLYLVEIYAHRRHDYRELWLLDTFEEVCGKIEPYNAKLDKGTLKRIKEFRSRTGRNEYMEVELNKEYTLWLKHYQGDRESIDYFEKYTLMWFDLDGYIYTRDSEKRATKIDGRMYNRLKDYCPLMSGHMAFNYVVGIRIYCYEADYIKQARKLEIYRRYKG